MTGRAGVACGFGSVGVGVCAPESELEPESGLRHGRPAGSDNVEIGCSDEDDDDDGDEKEEEEEEGDGSDKDVGKVDDDDDDDEG